MENIDCDRSAEDLPRLLAKAAAMSAPIPADLAGKSQLKAPEKIQLGKLPSSSKRRSKPAKEAPSSLSFDRIERDSDGGMVIVFRNNKFPRMPSGHGPPRRVFGSAGNRRREASGGSSGCLPMVVLLGALLFCYFKLFYGFDKL